MSTNVECVDAPGVAKEEELQLVSSRDARQSWETRLVYHREGKGCWTRGSRVIQQYVLRAMKIARKGFFVGDVPEMYEGREGHVFYQTHRPHLPTLPVSEYTSFDPKRALTNFEPSDYA